MREIKFRGKMVYNDEWIYGYLVKDKIGCFRIYNTPFGSSKPTYNYVSPSTVSQYTGINDKNGKEIYEGDVAKLKHCTALYTCTWAPEAAFFYWASKVSNYYLNMHHEAEVIGNIYDNPELMEDASNG